MFVELFTLHYFFHKNLYTWECIYGIVLYCIVLSINRLYAVDAFKRQEALCVYKRHLTPVLRV